MFLNKPLLSSPGKINSLPAPKIFLKVPSAPKNLPELPFKPFKPFNALPEPEPANLAPKPAVKPPNSASLVSIPDAFPATAVKAPLAIGPIPGIKLTATGATFFTTFFTFLNILDKNPNCCNPVN